MSKRSIRTHTLTTKTPESKIAIEVFYEEGGANYFSGAWDDRGYYFSAQPVTIVDGFESFRIGSGCRRIIESSPMFNQTRLMLLADQIRSDPFKAAPLVEQVLLDENLELSDHA